MRTSTSNNKKPDLQNAFESLADAFGAEALNLETADLAGVCTRINQRVRELRSEANELEALPKAEFRQLLVEDDAKAIKAKAAELGDLVPSILRSFLKDADYTTRWLGAYAVATEVGQVPDGLPIFLSLLSDTNAGVRYQAICALERCWKEDALIIPALAAATADVNFEVREKAAAVLGSLGPRAAPAIPALARMGEESGTVAVIALAKIGAKSDLVIPGLLRTIGESSSQTLENLRAAARLLARYGNQAKETLPRIRSAAEHWGDSPRGDAIRAAIREIESS